MAQYLAIPTALRSPSRSSPHPAVPSPDHASPAQPRPKHATPAPATDGDDGSDDSGYDTGTSTAPSTPTTRTGGPTPTIAVRAGTPSSPTTAPPDGAPRDADDDLSEAELRKLFEDEEIERFLHLFTNNVHSVTAAGSLVPDAPPATAANPNPAPAPPIALPPDLSILNACLLRALIPRLPTEPVAFSQDPAEPFTMAKLQANATRLYLFFPVYSRFFAGVWRIASWKDWGHSARMCAGYWLLWYYDLLLPTLLLRILFSLVRRRFLPYPSLGELRAHRARTHEAAQFGEAAKLNYQGVLGITEMLGWKTAWRAWRNSKRRRKVGEKVEAEAEGIEEEVEEEMREEEEEEEADEGEADEHPAKGDDVSVALEAAVSPSASVTSFGSADSAASTASVSSALSAFGLFVDTERQRAQRAAGKEERKRAREAAREAARRRREAEREEARRRKEEEKERRRAEKVEESQRRAEEKVRSREEDWRKGIMVALGEMADLNERIKNMFLWRNPAASRVYTCVIAGLSLFTLLTPAHYFAKTIYALLGIAFFFLVPFLSAMPAPDRARLPPAFSDVPTDAQYAYSLIRDRAVRGESLVPVERDKNGNVVGARAAAAEDAAGQRPLSPLSPAPSISDKPEAERSPWDRFLHRGWTLAEGSGRALRGEPSLSDDPAAASSFPAQMDGGALGTIYISAAELWFVPLLGPEVRTPLDDVTGVRKLRAFGLGGGRWGGLEMTLRVAVAEEEPAPEPVLVGQEKDENGEEQEQERPRPRALRVDTTVLKFPFVGKRNEAFTLLVAISGHNWVRT